MDLQRRIDQLEAERDYWKEKFEVMEKSVSSICDSWEESILKLAGDETARLADHTYLSESLPRMNKGRT